MLMTIFDPKIFMMMKFYPKHINQSGLYDAGNSTETPQMNSSSVSFSKATFPPEVLSLKCLNFLNQSSANFQSNFNFQFLYKRKFICQVAYTDENAHVPNFCHSYLKILPKLLLNWMKYQQICSVIF